MKIDKRKSLSELSKEDILRACEENYLHFWRCVGTSKNADFSEERGITQCITGLSQDVFNVVLKCSIDPEIIDFRIDEAINFFRSHRIPLLWHTGILSETKDIGRYLEARGFPKDYELTAMAVDLDSLNDNVDIMDSVSIKTVASRKDIRSWAETLVSAWESPRETISWMLDNACFNPSIEESSTISLPRKIYLGHLEEKPVSTLMLIWDQDVAGLEMVGTVPSARYMGVGTAVVQAALSDAHAMGFEFVVVLATIEGVKLYEKCGFKAFGKLPEHTMDFMTPNL